MTTSAEPLEMSLLYLTLSTLTVRLPVASAANLTVNVVLSSEILNALSIKTATLDTVNLISFVILSYLSLPA